MPTGPGNIVYAFIVVFLIATLGAALTDPLQDQVTSWKANLTTAGQTGAAALVNVIPLLFWILIAVGVILTIYMMVLPRRTGGL